MRLHPAAALLAAGIASGLATRVVAPHESPHDPTRDAVAQLVDPAAAERFRQRAERQREETTIFALTAIAAAGGLACLAFRKLVRPTLELEQK